MHTRILLTGFMGSGKSTTGRLLAGTLGYAFLDLDDVIAAAAQKSIPEIFATDGEPAFRRAETAALTLALQQANIVIALGGGVLDTEANRTLLRTQPAIVHLAVSFAEAADRCTRDLSNSRPNFADRALAEARFHRRLPLYQAAATIEVSTAGRSPAAVAAAIHAALHKFSSPR